MRRRVRDGAGLLLVFSLFVWLGNQKMIYVCICTSEESDMNKTFEVEVSWFFSGTYWKLLLGEGLGTQDLRHWRRVTGGVFSIDQLRWELKVEATITFLRLTRLFPQSVICYIDLDGCWNDVLHQHQTKNRRGARNEGIVRTIQELTS